MKKRTIEQIIHDEMEKKAIIMCKRFCKYGEQYEKDQEKYNNEDQTYKKHCCKCPMIEFY